MTRLDVSLMVTRESQRMLPKALTSTTTYATGFRVSPVLPSNATTTSVDDDLVPNDAYVQDYSDAVLVRPICPHAPRK